YAPEGLTTLAKDSIFMMPQLGILSTLLPEAATEVFEKDCLVRIADCLAPIGTAKEGEECFTAIIDGKSHVVPFGEIVLVPMDAGRSVDVECKPGKAFDFGDGKGRSRTFTAVAGEIGLVLDGRGRPIVIPVEDADRAATMRRWLEAMGLSSS
ncbi:MAG: methylaspartate mutase, partial [Armatimonadota bacterium]